MSVLFSSLKSGLRTVQESYDNVGRRTHIGLVTGLLMLPAFANASGQNLGAIGTNVANSASGLTRGALNIAGFIGIILIIVAFVKGRGARQQGEGIGTYVGMAVIGAMLFAIPTVISVFSTTVFGTDSSVTTGIIN